MGAALRTTVRAAARTASFHQAISALAIAVLFYGCENTATSSPVAPLAAKFKASASAESAAPQSVQARSANEFVNSIGINTHLTYFGTVYGNYTGVVKPRLAELGVKHVRDCGSVTSMDSWMRAVYGRCNDLYKSLGITFDAATTPLPGQSYFSTPPIARLLKFLDPSAVEAFEGANELDDQGDGNWVAKDRAWQQALYRTVRSISVVTDKPVIGPSLVNRTNALKLGSLTEWIDFGNMHSYPGDSIPSAYLEKNVANYSPMNGSKPIRPTETGYPTDPNSHYWVSEATTGKYVPRLYLEYWKFGFSRSFVYQLADEGSQANGINGWGLLHGDGSPKAGFTALKNLIGVLSDAGGDFAPGSLTYSIGDVPATVHSALFQKSSGNFFLVLWNEVASFDRHRHVALSPAPVSATLTLASTPGVLVFHLPTLGTTTTVNPAQSVALQIPDHPLIIEIGLSGAPASVPSTTTDPTPPSTPATPGPANGKVKLGEVPYHRDSIVTQIARLPLAQSATVR